MRDHQINITCKHLDYPDYRVQHHPPKIHSRERSKTVVESIEFSEFEPALFSKESEYSTGFIQAVIQADRKVEVLTRNKF